MHISNAGKVAKLAADHATLNDELDFAKCAARITVACLCYPMPARTISVLIGAAGHDAQLASDLKQSIVRYYEDRLAALRTELESLGVTF